MDDSLIRRYSYKLGANLLGLPANLAIQWLAVRALGPLGYGSYTYLNGFFTEVCNFFDAGTSTGFYAKLCARPGEKGLLTFYWRLAGAIAGLVITLTALLIGLGWRDLIWPGQGTPFILLAALGAISLWVVNVAGKIVDAFGLTTAGETARLAQRLTAALSLALLFCFGWLDLTTFLIAQVVLAALLLGLWGFQLARGGRSMTGGGPLEAGAAKGYALEFWEYSHPLVTFALIAMLAGVADRWLLQRLAGSVEQGFFGLSQQVGTFCFVFTSAMVPLLAREFSQACQMKDVPRMARDFARHLPRFYLLSAFVGVFAASQADRIALLLGGKAFSAAGIPLLIMCLYPIHQTYGQLNISVFYATGQTRLHRNIGVIFLVLGLGFTYWLLAPPSLGGLGLGSLGLALKMVLSQVIVVNVQLLFNTRRLGLSYAWFIGHQLIVLVLLAAVAGVTRLTVSAIGLPLLLDVAATGISYVIASAGLVWFFPGLGATSQQEIGGFLRQLRARVSGAVSPGGKAKP